MNLIEKITLPKKILGAFLFFMLIVCQSAWADVCQVSKVEFVGLRSVSAVSAANALLPFKNLKPITSANQTKNPSVVRFKMGAIKKGESKTLVQNLSNSRFKIDTRDIDCVSGTMIFHVTEHPIIGDIAISGNTLIPKEGLEKALKDEHIAVGSPYDASILDSIKEQIEAVYRDRGKPNARVDVTEKEIGTSTINISITVSEGRSATISQIKFIGNHAFTNSVLLKQLSMTTPTLFSWFTHDDEFSKAKLATDTAAIEKYYQDRGYFDVKITPSFSYAQNMETASVFYNIVEGPVSRVAGFKFIWLNSRMSSFPRALPLGKLEMDLKAMNKAHLVTLLKPLATEAVLDSKIPLKVGQAYSSQTMEDTEKAIQLFLGDQGYALAEVPIVNTTLPEQKAKHELSFAFLIVPGHRMTVNKIQFIGNTATNDSVMRSVMQITEGQQYSQSAVDESTEKLNQLPFLKNITFTKKPVEGNPGLVNLDYSVKETPAASANFGVGYSQEEGLLLMTSLTQQNFLGEGKTLGISFTTSAYQRIYQLNYFNPYFTTRNVGFGYSAYYQKNNFADANAADYVLNNYGFSSYFSLPVTLRNTISLGGGFDHSQVKLGGTPSTQLTKFVSEFGSNFNNANLTTGWTYATLNRAIFPTKGLSSVLNLLLAVPTDSRSFRYYSATYSLSDYYPILGSNFIFVNKEDVYYGNGYGSSKRMPFYKNFYLGGMGSVRGYEFNSLGPQDSMGQSLGGNAAVDASIGVIIPNPISPDNLRTSVFVDAGNVYNTHPDPALTGVNPTGLRYSAGVEADWLSPLGPLKFAFSKALNATSTDDTSPFQFSVGTQF